MDNRGKIFWRWKRGRAREREREREKERETERTVYSNVRAGTQGYGKIEGRESLKSGNYTRSEDWSGVQKSVKC